MAGLDVKSADPDQYPAPPEDEESLALQRDWTPEEEAKAKRK
jgi:hypothetical protein